MKKRGEAEISTTWKLEDMVPDNETWEKQLKEASKELEKYGDFKGKNVCMYMPECVLTKIRQMTCIRICFPEPSF